MSDKVMRALENAPLPKWIENIAASIGQAQHEIDKKSIEIFQTMVNRDEHGVQLPGESGKKSMIELGFMPSFYHFASANIDFRVTFSAMEHTEKTFGGSIGAVIKVVAISFNASYTQKYSFEATASSTVTTKIVSIPPPSKLRDKIDELTN